MKSKKLIVFSLLLLLMLYFAWSFFLSGMHPKEQKFFHVHTGANYESVLNDLKTQGLLNNSLVFNAMARLLSYPGHIHPGQYELREGMSMYELLKNLKSGRQKEVRLVIGKIRTKSEFAHKLSQQFECDSLSVMKFIQSNDSLAPYKLDTNSVLTAIIPNSYLFWWNSSFGKIFKRLEHQQALFWKGERSTLSAQKGLTPLQVYIIASIVEEETTRKADKGKIASVYINRIRRGMKMEACPTIKYAWNDFGMTRILNQHLTINSPYNTYRNAGLPPGPICTPSIETIEEVLHAPETSYLFFAANCDMKGGTVFASTYSEHLANGRAYQRVLDSLTQIKKLKVR